MVASRPPKIAAQEPAAPKRRQRRTPEAARELILQTAQRLIAERGPDRIGLKEIAQAAGISHALINHYFGSYEALVEETIRAQVRRSHAQIGREEFANDTSHLLAEPGVAGVAMR